MNVLLLLNGPENWQTGIEDGFIHLRSIGAISSLEWFYIQDYSRKHGIENGLARCLEIADAFQPDLIIIFHIAKFHISGNLLKTLKNLKSKPLLAYDEGDMYGSFAKPITRSMKTILKHADVVSIRGLGRFYKSISKYNQNIFYMPHHSDIARFDKKPHVLRYRKHEVVMIGNRVDPGPYGFLRRLPGAKDRARLVKAMGSAFRDNFLLYGDGWEDYYGNQGPLDFQKQLDVYRDSWITIAYEHYPEIPYYFSNRLPLALLAGSIYICHYHKGYDHIFQNCDFIFLFDSKDEAVDVVKYVLSLDRADLYDRGKRAREFSLKHYHPNTCWENYINNIKRIT